VHTSKASRTYYLKTHIQYFDDVFRSLVDLDRCLRSSGQCVLVVQDSFYKDVHNDLPAVFCEMAASIGWIIVFRQDFPITRTMAHVNGRARKYCRSDHGVESVLWFEKIEQEGSRG